MRRLTAAILLIFVGSGNLGIFILLLVMERLYIYEGNLTILYGEIALSGGITLFAIYNYWKELKSRQRHSADKE